MGKRSRKDSPSSRTEDVEYLYKRLKRVEEELRRKTERDSSSSHRSHSRDRKERRHRGYDKYDRRSYYGKSVDRHFSENELVSDSSQDELLSERERSPENITSLQGCSNTHKVQIPVSGDAEVENVFLGDDSQTVQVISPNNYTEEVDNSKEQDIELGEEILEIFGDRLMPGRELAPAIHKDLAVRWEEVIKGGLPVEERKLLLKKFPPPKNCSSIDPPKLNLEVKAALESTVLKRDIRIEEKQVKIAAAIAGVGRSLSLLLKGNSLDKMNNLEYLSGVARLLADLQRDETMVRRNLILKNIKPLMRDTLKDTESDEYLFGKDLVEKLKAAKAMQQSSKDLKQVFRKSSEQDKGSKNYKGPSRWNQFRGSAPAKTGNPKSMYNRRQKPYPRSRAIIRKNESNAKKED